MGSIWKGEDSKCPETKYPISQLFPPTCIPAGFNFGQKQSMRNKEIYPILILILSTVLNLPAQHLQRKGAIGIAPQPLTEETATAQGSY